MRQETLIQFGCDSVLLIILQNSAHSSVIHNYSFSKKNLTCNTNCESQKAKIFIYAFTDETDIFISQYSHKIIE